MNRLGSHQCGQYSQTVGDTSLLADRSSLREKRTFGFRPHTCLKECGGVKNMIHLRKTRLLLWVFCLLSAASAYGQPSGSLRVLRGQTETMSFLAWIVLGLVAAFIGSQILH